MKSKSTILALFASAALLQANDTDLANPTANLISVPVQSNVDFGVDPGWGLRFGLTFLFPN